MNADTLLSDEFLKFSATIKGLREEKDTLNEEFKKKYAEHKQKLAAIDSAAVQARQDFEEWTKEQEAASSS